jgi:hypothetical protein
MEIDIEALLAAKREQREKSNCEMEQSGSERQQRYMKKQKERDEIYEREFRRQAARVLACVTQEYSPTRLHDWFLLDHWTAQDGLVLLCGFDPRHVPFDVDGHISIPNDPGKIAFDPGRDREIEQVRRLDNLALYSLVTKEVLGDANIRAMDQEFMSAHGRILRIWNSGSHTETRYPPKYFIDWAIKKNVSIPWLEWAKNYRYYDDPSSALGPISPAANGSKDVSPKSETAFLHIIGALCDLYWNAAHEGQEYSQTVLLSKLKMYEGFHGMSERNLKEKLTKAVRAIKS